MSVVTGVMLITSLSEEACVAEVQEWLSAAKGGQQLRDVSDKAGGRKHPQFEAWAAGINGFWDEDDFAAHVLSRDWIAPENVVLILQPEDGSTRVFRPGDRIGVNS